MSTTVQSAQIARRILARAQLHFADNAMTAQTCSAAQSPHGLPPTAKTSSGLERNYPGFLATLGFAALLLASSPALAQTVGAAQSFAILGGTAVTAAPPLSTVNGDVGITPAAGTFITGFPANATITPPFTNHGNDAFAIAAGAATLTLFNSAALAPAGGTAITANLSTGGPSANGHYVPGRYSLAVGTAIIPTTITLDGAGIYVFSLNSDITTSVGSTVILNGADPCTVFWRVPTLATLNGITFPGTVVAGTGVHLGTGASLTGRALALAAGDVTMAGGNTVGGCSAAGPGLAATTLISPVAAPSVALGAAISDTKTLSGGANPTGTITFNLYGPNDATCSGAVIFTSTVTVNGNGSYSSTSFTPLAIGTYRWIANYGGDLNNAPTANVCNAANEFVVVAAGPPAGSNPIPTLSESAMVLLVAFLAIAGLVAMRRRER
jgi:Ice-binding-like/IPTL-CTERM motif